MHTPHHPLDTTINNTDAHLTLAERKELIDYSFESARKNSLKMLLYILPLMLLTSGSIVALTLWAVGILRF